MKRQSGSINSQVKPDCAGNHHDDDKALRSEHADARPHVGANEQSARCPGHREPDAFQDMGRFSYTESHRRNPQRVRGNQIRIFWFCVEGIARRRPGYSRPRSDGERHYAPARVAALPRTCAARIRPPTLTRLFVCNPCPGFDGSLSSRPVFATLPPIRSAARREWAEWGWRPKQNWLVILAV